MVINITNRELLRQYKTLKNKLIRGEVEEIHIPQSAGSTLILKVSASKTPFQRFVEKVHQHPLAKLERPKEDLF